MIILKLKTIKSPDDILEIVSEIGFLPFFANDISGFSIEENIAPKYWFSADTDGAWEWKGRLAKSGKCVYGKLFRGKAGFVSREWLPDLANYRRDGYDFEGFYEDGHANYKDKDVYDEIEKRGAVLSKELKRRLNYRKGGNKGFDAVITRLQMQTFVCVADFEYMRDKHGREYGWGVAKYTTPETIFGEEFVLSAYDRKPEESKMRIVGHLQKILPDVSEQHILRFIK